MDAPGEKLLIKLWETLAEKGIGGLLQPWQEKRLAKARLEIRANELLNLAYVENQVYAIKTGKLALPIESKLKTISNLPTDSNQTNRIEPTIDLSDLIIKTTQLEISENIRKEVNITKAIMIAEDILAQDPHEPPEAIIEDDWLFSWRENAARVSSEKLQSLWGKILAGELKQPGSFSIRTLEFLKNLSKSEAELISKISKFVIRDIIYRNNLSLLEEEGIQFTDLLILQNIGILSGVETGLTTTFFSATKEQFSIDFWINNKVIIINHNDPTKKATAEVFLLTSVGKEVLKLPNFPINEEYLLEIAKGYVRQGFIVHIADWIQQDGGSRGLYNTRKVEI